MATHLPLFLTKTDWFWTLGQSFLKAFLWPKTKIEESYMHCDKRIFILKIASLLATNQLFPLIFDGMKVISKRLRASQATKPCLSSRLQAFAKMEEARIIVVRASRCGSPTWATQLLLKVGANEPASPASPETGKSGREDDAIADLQPIAAEDCSHQTEVQNFCMA